MNNSCDGCFGAADLQCAECPKNKKKRGRPKSSEPIRDVQYRLRITPEEHQFLKELSKRTGYTISKLIREGALSSCYRQYHMRNIYGIPAEFCKKTTDVE